MPAPDPDRQAHARREERTYLLRRAEAHRRSAQDAREPAARAAHERLAHLYREQADLLALVFPD